MISVGRHEDVFFIKAEHQTVCKEELLALKSEIDKILDWW